MLQPHTEYSWRARAASKRRTWTSSARRGGGGGGGWALWGGQTGGDDNVSTWRVGLIIQFDVYTVNSDRKQLPKFPATCPLDLHSSSFSACDRSLSHSTSMAAKWMAASREHLLRYGGQVAFHHRTSRHRCLMRHRGRVCAGDGGGGTDGRGFGMVGQ